jgi:hypothetical protein
VDGAGSDNDEEFVGLAGDDSNGVLTALENGSFGGSGLHDGV